jgi:hypothetical protein
LHILFGQCKEDLKEQILKKNLEDSNIVYLTGNDVKKMLDKAEKDVFQ